MTSPAQDSNGAAAVDYNWIKSSSTTSDQTKLHKQGSSTSGRLFDVVLMTVMLSLSSRRGCQNLTSVYTGAFLTSVVSGT